MSGSATSDSDVLTPIGLAPVEGLDDDPRPDPADAVSWAVWRRVLAVPRLGTWLGLALVGVGFGLIALAWGRVSLLAAVSVQMPYVVSAGLTGLGLVVVGGLLIAVDTKLETARTQSMQLDAMCSVLQDLQEKLRTLESGAGR